MENQPSGIDGLIAKVKKEVEEEAEAKGQAIVKAAQEKASSIISDAQKQAKMLLSETQRVIEKQRNALHEELSLAARDFSLRLREELKKNMFFPIIQRHARTTLKDPDFLKRALKEIIITILASDNQKLDILVSNSTKEALAGYFASCVFDELDEGKNFSLMGKDNLEGFVLLRKEDHCLWDFRVETVAEELLKLVEPSLRKYFSLNLKPQNKHKKTESSLPV